jgi:hypothetical protein
VSCTQELEAAREAAAKLEVCWCWRWYDNRLPTRGVVLGAPPSTARETPLCRLCLGFRGFQPLDCVPLKWRALARGDPAQPRPSVNGGSPAGFVLAPVQPWRWQGPGEQPSTPSWRLAFATRVSWRRQTWP